MDTIGACSGCAGDYEDPDCGSEEEEQEEEETMETEQRFLNAADFTGEFRIEVAGVLTRRAALIALERARAR